MFADSYTADIFPATKDYLGEIPMKFTRLVEKIEKFFNKQEQGKHIDPENLEKLQQLLVDKRSRYEAKLEASQDPEKRKKLETKLKVVNAHLVKSKEISSNPDNS